MTYACLIATGSLVLSGCAQTMDAASCAQADWRAIGFEDGAKGAPMTAFPDRAATCAKQGHSADRVAYDAGRAEGLRSFCTYENAYSEGYARRDFRNVCPAELADAYREGFRRGLEDRRTTYVWPNLGIDIGVSGGSSGRVGVGVGTGIGIGF